MATVFIPSLMQNLSEGADRVIVEGNTVRKIIDNLEEVHTGFKARLLDNRGKIKPNISVAVDGEVSEIGILERVSPNSEVHFLPAIAGGNV